MKKSPRPGNVFGAALLPGCVRETSPAGLGVHVLGSDELKDRTQERALALPDQRPGLGRALSAVEVHLPKSWDHGLVFKLVHRFNRKATTVQ